MCFIHPRCCCSMLLLLFDKVILVFHAWILATIFYCSKDCSRRYYTPSPKHPYMKLKISPKCFEKMALNINFKRKIDNGGYLW